MLNLINKEQSKPWLVFPHLNSSLPSFSSVVATFFNFAKASIGSGSFALPFAVLSAGVIIGSLGMILLGVVR